MAEEESNELWQLADKNKDGALDVEEIETMLKQVNVKMTKKQVNAMVQEVAPNRSKVTKAEFALLFDKVKDNRQLKGLFARICDADATKGMDRNAFESFLRNVQGESVSSATTIANASANASAIVDMDAFVRYLSQDEHSLYDYERRRLGTDDMTQPWTHYFVNSSHNTYLTGDQLQSASSTDAYSYALRLGCRCVEMDCWDGPDGEPIIYHGFTLTSKITFKNVVEVIKRDAFVASPYPLVLSLEVHCSLEQQTRMAEILVQVLGDLLVTQPVLDDGRVPSPEQLKHRIIVKGKHALTRQKSSDSLPDDSNNNNDDDEPESPVALQLKAPVKRHKDATHKVAEKLGVLAVHMQARKCKVLADASQTHTGHHVSSFAESKATKFVRKDFINFSKFTSLAFARIYPAGTRVDSSNLCPVAFWQAGCQLAALNYQTFDRNMQINRGFFLQNGNAGYLLKPAYLRNPTDQPSSHSKTSVELTIISGYRFPKPHNDTKGEIVDPYVLAELIVPTLKNSDLVDIEKRKTSTVDDNGWNPTWLDLANLHHHNKPFPHDTATHGHGHKFHFKLGTTDPSLAFLRLAVYDKDFDRDDFLAVAVVPVSCLKKGYRFVRLFGHRGEVLSQAHLFVHVHIKHD